MASVLCCGATRPQGSLLPQTVVDTPNLPGTIHSVAEEVANVPGSGGSLGIQLDMRDVDSIENCVDKVVSECGQLDILINNASALWWKPIVGTPQSRYDLINGINARGTFAITRAALPHLAKSSFGGHVVTQSPPIVLQDEVMVGRVGVLFIYDFYVKLYQLRVCRV